MFRLALSTHIYFFLFDTPIVTLRLLALQNACCGNACFRAQVSSKYGTWYSERVILQFMCVGSLAGVTYLRYTVLMSSNRNETAIHCCGPALSVLVMLVSASVFHVVSALQSFAFKLYLGFFHRRRTHSVTFAIQRVTKNDPTNNWPAPL